MLGATLGSYRIVSLIGEGGMGVVYLGEHTLLGRKVAVKLLHPAMSQQLVERFFNEARAAASLKHIGIVDVFDFGHHSDGSAFIVMEYLEGESLSDRLAREKRLPIAFAAVIARQVASALHVAHQQGIVHRDLKPENIFLVPDTEAPGGIRAKVLDFGIAKLVRDPSPSVKTHSGTVFGTPRYMSPEQCKNARNVDARGDIYSLGCILYEMVAGTTPFEADNWGELVAAHLREPPLPVREHDPTIPGPLEVLVMRMLEKRPDDRPESMAEVAKVTEGVWRAYAGTADVPVFTPPSGIELRRPTPAPGAAPGSSAGAPQPVRASDPTVAAADTGPVRRDKRPPWALIVGGAVVVIGGAIAIVVLGRGRDDNTSREPVAIVVDQRIDARQPSSVTPPPLDAAAADPVASPDAAPAQTASDAGARAIAPGSAAPPRPPPASGDKPDLAQLKKDFVRQSAPVASCFKAHPTDVSEAVSLRFQLDEAGKVVVAEVLPESLNATPLGTCITKAARAITFGPQPHNVQFRVPIRTSGG